jgi:hypothetical protein
MKRQNILLISAALFFAAARPAAAVCPVCTVAVGAGLGLAQWLGIDDVLSGVWIGGLIVSLAFWNDAWLVKKMIGYRGLFYCATC